MIAKVIELLPTAEARDNVNEFGPEVAHLWAQRKSLTLINDVLHRNFETTDGTVEFQQVVVPLELIPTFLYWVHSDPSSGHMGIQKTTEKLKRYAYWTGWRRDVELFVRRCETCCRYRKGPVKHQGTMKDTASSYPFQKLHVDLTGLHRKSSGGHVYLLTGICSFTKYLVAVPIKDKSAISVAKALLNNVYLVYGGSEI